MSMSDPIADKLTRIRNARPPKRSRGGAEQRMKDSSPRSSTTRATSKTSRSENDGKPVIEIALKYYADKPEIGKIERVSHPGLRIYKGREDIPAS